MARNRYLPPMNITTICNTLIAMASAHVSDFVYFGNALRKTLHASKSKVNGHQVWNFADFFLDLLNSVYFHIFITWREWKHFPWWQHKFINKYLTVQNTGKSEAFSKNNILPLSLHNFFHFEHNNIIQFFAACRRPFLSPCSVWGSVPVIHSCSSHFSIRISFAYIRLLSLSRISCHTFSSSSFSLPFFRAFLAPCAPPLAGNLWSPALQNDVQMFFFFRFLSVHRLIYSWCWIMRVHSERCVKTSEIPAR